MESQMTIDGELVRALRERKSWSQEHLAGAAGLSVRTVQRVEVENVASAETRLALAAALGVPVADLIPAPAVAPAPVVANGPVQAGAARLVRNVLLGLTVFFAFAFASIVLLNALSGFLN